MADVVTLAVLGVLFIAFGSWWAGLIVGAWRTPGYVDKVKKGGF